VDSETETYSRWIGSLFKRVVASLEGLTEAQLNWRPPIAGANSVYVIAAHTMGSARACVLGVACGQEMGRDRPAEFRATGGYAQIADETRKFLEEVKAALAGLPASALERRVVPSQELWGEGEVREISIRQALMAAVEHAAIHLGELHIARELALREAAR
jgi:hypothetical protein